MTYHQLHITYDELFVFLFVENSRLQENVRHLEKRLDRFREENRNLTRQLGVAARRVTEVREETNELCAQLRTSLDALMAKKKAADRTNAEERDVLTRSLRETLNSLADENQELRLRLHEYENADGVGTPVKNAARGVGTPMIAENAADGASKGRGSIVPVTNGLPLRSYDSPLPSPSGNMSNHNGMRLQSDLLADADSGNGPAGPAPSGALREDPPYHRGGEGASSLRSPELELEPAERAGNKFFDDMPRLSPAYDDSGGDAYTGERQGGWMSWLGW